MRYVYNPHAVSPKGNSYFHVLMKEPSDGTKWNERHFYSLMKKHSIKGEVRQVSIIFPTKEDAVKFKLVWKPR
jgi:hypothetical protein